MGTLNADEGTKRRGHTSRNSMCNLDPNCLSHSAVIIAVWMLLSDPFMLHLRMKNNEHHDKHYYDDNTDDGHDMMVVAVIESDDV